MTWICDNCHTEWCDENEATKDVVHHMKDCASCTNGYDIPERDSEDE